ncbi:MAG: alkaline phosphatase D family protein [Xanthomonadales bacterium]|nr:alkaline phosphatase D family protein [Xanthomonadales bacterium]
MRQIADWIRHLSRGTTLPRDPLARRRFLERAAWTTTALALAPGLLGRAPAQNPTRVRLTADPFTLGVASGYPHPGGFSLWTRLAPGPLRADGGIEGDARIPVRCEVAEDEGFARIVRSIDFDTAPEVGHSVHLDVDGLEAGRGYHYRFQCGDARSAVGRTHTLPAAGARIERFRIAFASCQNLEHGWFSAYRQMQRDAPDLVLFLGDYIYESQWGVDLVRRHLGSEPTTLAGYRVRHAQYKLDPDLQAMHATGPWAFAWDDHEVDNDYAGAQSENLDPSFLLRRAAAYQAYFEHLPMPRRMYPRHDEMRMYTHLDIGDLLRVCLLDARQYRTPQPCPRPNRHSSQVAIGCTELRESSQTMLGAAQERWLSQRLRDSGARWNLIAQQGLFAPLDEQPGDERGAFTDMWEGYPLARERVLADLRDGRTRNPVFAGGDMHTAVAAAVPGDPARVDSAPVASEFVATSLSAESRPQSWYDERLPENPHVRQLRSDQRGYTLLDFARGRLDATLQVVRDVHVQDAQFEVQARYMVEDGRAGPQRA